MKLTKFLASAAFAVTLPLAAFADVAANKATAVAAMTETFVGLDASTVETYFAAPYIQHNPIGGSGLPALTGVLQYLKGKGATLQLETARVFGEDDLVVMHNVWTGFGPKPLVVFDVFRFDDNGKIVEHWDNMTPVAAPNPSGRTQTDGATAVVDLDKTDANKALVTEFLTRAMVNGEDLDFTKYINPETYIQHNSMVGDGLMTFGKFLHALEEKGIHIKFDKVHQVIAEGNFVLSMSEGSFGDQHDAFFDLFRVEDGLIVEHWDVIAPMPAGDKLPENYPGKF